MGIRRDVLFKKNDGIQEWTVLTKKQHVVKMMVIGGFCSLTINQKPIFTFNPVAVFKRVSGLDLERMFNITQMIWGPMAKCPKCFCKNIYWCRDKEKHLVQMCLNCGHHRTIK